MISFDTLWGNHPGLYSKPCNFMNQCAIRMGIAFQKSNISLSTFNGSKCWHEHSPRHILRAQELADWMKDNPGTFGIMKEFSNVSSNSFQGFKGIVFIKDGWGSTDHIDLWNGSTMKAGEAAYLDLGKSVWFWNLTYA